MQVSFAHVSLLDRIYFGIVASIAPMNFTLKGEPQDQAPLVPANAFHLDPLGPVHDDDHALGTLITTT